MGKISDYTRVLAAKLADVFVVDQTDNGTTETKSATVEQIGTAIGTLQNFADLDTSNKNLVDAINEVASYTPVYGNTASGAIATFDTSLALPLQDCTIAINAVQESGTPTPSSPKAISGFTGANIYDKGINLWDEDWELGNISTSDGQPSTSTLYIRSKVYCACKGGATYYCKSHSTSQLVIYWYSANDTYLGFDVCTNTTKTAPANAVKFKIRCEVTTYSNDISINYPATDTAYHAYNANSTTTAITWQSEAGTVYGGSLKVYGNGTAKLPVTHGAILLDGSQGESAFAVTPYTNYTRVEWLGYRDIGILDPVFMSDKFEFISGIPQELYKIGGSSGGVRCWLCLPTTITTKAEANTWFSNNPTFVRYPLATPVEYTLTGIPPIYTLNGTNNIFTDTNGDTSVVYACSLKDYIEGQ